MKENINALDEIHKGSCMGIDAITFLFNKIKDNNLKKLLKKQYKFYKNINQEIEKIYPSYNNDTPHKTSNMNKIMTYYGIEIKTLFNKSTSKLSEMLIQGTNMGIIEGRRILNKKIINKEVNNIIDNYVQGQEKYLDELKKFL